MARRIERICRCHRQLTINGSLLSLYRIRSSRIGCCSIKRGLFVVTRSSSLLKVSSLGSTPPPSAAYQVRGAQGGTGVAAPKNPPKHHPIPPRKGSCHLSIKKQPFLRVLDYPIQPFLQIKACHCTAAENVLVVRSDRVKQ